MKTQGVRAACMGSMRTRIMTPVGLALAVGGMSMAPAFGKAMATTATATTRANSSMARITTISITRGIHSNMAWITALGITRGIIRIRTTGRLINMPTMTTVAATITVTRTMCMRPQPVVYAPESAPGISLFIPLQFR